MSKWAAGESDSEDEVVADLNPAQDALDAIISDSRDQATELAGLLMNINLNSSEDEVIQFLHSRNLRPKVLELIAGDHFARAKVLFEDQQSFDEFMRLTDVVWKGEKLRAKQYEERGPRYQDRRSGRFGGRGGRGGREHRDRFHSNKPGNRDGKFGNSDFRRSDSREYQEGDRRSRRHGKEPAEKDSSVPEEPETPKERPKVILAPRTLPIENIGKTDRTSDIFGGGKPHDEFQYEEKKRQQLLQQQTSHKDTASAAVNEVKASANETPEPPKATEQPQPPKAGEEGEDRKHRGGRGGGRGFSSSSGKRFGNDFHNNKSFSKSRSRDDDRASQHTDLTPDATATEGSTAKAEDRSHNNEFRDNNRKSYRKGRGEGRFERAGEDHHEHRQSKRTNDFKAKKDRTSERGGKEENIPAETEIPAKTVKDNDGFEEYTKTGKSKGASKVNTAAAVVASKQSAAITPKTASNPVSTKNLYAGLESDSD